MAAASLGLALLAGCSNSDDSASTDATPTPLPTSTGALSPAPGASASKPAAGGTKQPRAAASVKNPTPSATINENGSTVVTHVYIPTKCGVEFMRFEDQWYRTPHPIKNPPEGWTKPTQEGDVRLVSKSHKHVQFEPYGLSDVIQFYRTKQTPPKCP